MNAVKYLLNYTQNENLRGGTESRHLNMQKVLPGSKRVSLQDIKNATHFMRENTTEDDIIISEAGVGLSKTYPAKTILFYGGPYYSLYNCERLYRDIGWKRLYMNQRKDSEGSVLNIAISEFMKKDMLSNGIKCDVVLNNPVDTNEFTSSERNKENNAVWLGSRHPLKGEIVVNYLEKKRGIKVDRIYKEDEHSREHIKDKLNNASFLICSSVIESNSNAVLEAMSMNKPLLTSDCGLFYKGCPKSVGELFVDRQSLLNSYDVLMDEYNTYKPRDYIFEQGMDLKSYGIKLNKIIEGII